MYFFFICTHHPRQTDRDAERSSGASVGYKSQVFAFGCAAPREGRYEPIIAKHTELRVGSENKHLKWVPLPFRMIGKRRRGNGCQAETESWRPNL